MPGREMRRFSLVLYLLSAATVAAEDRETRGEETYHMIFRSGVLDAYPSGSVFRYERRVNNRAAPEPGDRNARNVIEMTLTGGAQRDVDLRLLEEEKYRPMGRLPAGAGNPMIMVFMETVLRDMAGATGGGAYYIRNRMKEALIADASYVETVQTVGGGEVTARRITLRPFTDDANRARMGAFSDLTLRFTMSEAVPGWYYQLEAQAPDGGEGAPVYELELTFSETDMTE